MHTKALNVEVLGTSFDVKERQEGTRVVLTTGKVKLNLPDSPEQAEIYMAPRDLVEISKADRKISKKVVNPEHYSAWRNKTILLNNTTLAEIAKIIGETYGKSVHFEDPQLAETILNGTALPTNNLQTLLEALSTTLDVEVVQQKETILFKK